jgi:hypothetical protein
MFGWAHGGKTPDRLIAVLDADDTLFAKDWWKEPLAAAFGLKQHEFDAIEQSEIVRATDQCLGLIPEPAVVLKLAIERCIRNVPDHKLTQHYLWSIGEANASRFFPGFPDILPANAERVEDFSRGTMKFEVEIATCGLHAILKGMTTKFRRKHPGMLRIPSGQRLECEEPGVPATGIAGAYRAVDKALTIGYAQARGVAGANVFFAGDGETDILGAQQTKKIHGTNAVVFRTDPDPEIAKRTKLEGERVLQLVRKFDPNCGLYPAEWDPASSVKNIGQVLSEWVDQRVVAWQTQANSRLLA